MGNYLGLLWAFFRRDVKIAASYRIQFVFHLASVLTLCFTFFFLGLMMKDFQGQIPALEKYGGQYFGFALVGVAFSTYLDSALRSFGQGVRQAQVTGTLEAMLATKAPVGLVVAGSALYTLLFTSMRVLAFLLVGWGIFRLQFQVQSWSLVGLTLLLTVLATLVLGIFSAGFIVLFKQGDPVTAAISGLSWLLSGILYPKEILPGFVERAAELLPMTHSLQAMRLVLLRGAGWSEIAPDLRYLAAFFLLGLPLCLFWFSWAVSRAKKSGSLAHY